MHLQFNGIVLWTTNSRLFAERIFQNFKFDESLFEETLEQGVPFLVLQPFILNLLISLTDSKQ